MPTWPLGSFGLSRKIAYAYTKFVSWGLTTNVQESCSIPLFGIQGRPRRMERFPKPGATKGKGGPPGPGVQTSVPAVVRSKACVAFVAGGGVDHGFHVGGAPQFTVPDLPFHAPHPFSPPRSEQSA